MKLILLSAALSALAMLSPLPALAADETKNEIPAPADAALKSAKEVTLLSLQPYPDNLKDGFHGYKILGQTALTGADRTAGEAALRLAYQNWDKRFAKCFEPRHGVRVKSDGKTYDFVICFQCHMVHVHQDSKSLGSFGITAKPDALNKLLTAARIPLPEQTGDSPK